MRQKSHEERLAVLEVQNNESRKQLERIDSDLRELVQALTTHEKYILELVEESREQTRQLQRAHDNMSGIIKGLIYVAVFVSGAAATVSHFWNSIRSAVS